MGTNYYAVTGTCDHCGRGEDRKHIGKSSAGWCFGLHVYPDGSGPRDLDEWRAAWSEPGVVIRDEYGQDVTPAEMEAIVTARQGMEGGTSPRWYAENHAIAGPRGLARHGIDGWLCVGHGEGTWDEMVGEFS